MTDITHTQWASRPADERFWTVAELAASLQAEQPHLVESGKLDARTLTVEPKGAELALRSPRGNAAVPTYYAAGQLANLAGFSLAPFRKAEVPAELVAPVLTHGLRHRAGSTGDGGVKLYLRKPNGSPDWGLKAITGPHYSRVQHLEVCTFLNRLGESGWMPPPAWPSGAEGERRKVATAADIPPGVSIVQPGQEIAPAAVYYGPSATPELFVFMVCPSAESTIDIGRGRGLHRYALVWNSELGDASLGMELGYLDFVCGNHYRWGHRPAFEVRARHVGRGVFRAFGKMHQQAAIAQRGESAQQDAQRIAAAQRFEIAGSKDEVLTKLFNWNVAPRKTLEAAFTLAEQREESYGGPTTAWAQASALTELAGPEPIHKRRELESSAARVLERVPF